MDRPADQSAETRQAAGLAEARAFLAAHPDLEQVEFLLPDAHGILRGKWAPAKGLEKAFGDGIQLPYSVFGFDVWGREVMDTGLHIETGDKDGLCLAVPGSIRPITWTDWPSAQVFLSMHDQQGQPFALDPRHVLQRVVGRLAELGLKPVVAFELEFYLLDAEADLSAPGPISEFPRGPAGQQTYGLKELDKLEGLFADIREGAIAQDLPIDTIVSEAGPGQFEINLVHQADPFRAADEAILLQRLVRGVARRHGLTASFMAKPFAEYPGNGMHVHISLADETGANVFASTDGETLHKQAIGGLVATMPEALALFVNTFNGYRRLSPDSYAPTRAIWGFDNRSVAVRVPAGKTAARRVEHRISGADANPHLVLAGVLAGMMHGIAKKLAPPPPVDGNAYSGEGGQLTNHMGRAVDAFAGSAIMQDMLGDEFCRILAILKHAEHKVFEEKITVLEHETYL